MTPPCPLRERRSARLRKRPRWVRSTRATARLPTAKQSLTSRQMPLASARVGHEGDEVVAAVAELGEDLLAQVQALGREVVGALGEDVDEADEALHLREGHGRDHFRADLKELAGERGRLPGALGERLAELAPAGDLAGPQVRERVGAGAEVGRRDGRGRLAEVRAVVGPGDEVGE